MPNVLILSSNTGGGHRSAAAALDAAFALQFPRGQFRVRIANAVEESSPLSARLVRLYNWLLRHRQPSMKYLYWSVNRFRPDSQELFYRRSTAYISRLFDAAQPDIIVSVHPLVQEIPCRVLRDRGIAGKVPVVTVVTDPCYGFWKGWACDGVSRYFVAGAEPRRQLIDYGVAPERIGITGMPVHPRFEGNGESADREELAKAARRDLGLDPEKFTVLVNAGSEGGGNILKIFGELVRETLPIQGIFLAGKNVKLRAKAESIARGAAFPAKVLGYSDEMPQLMRASSAMITKLGGLTIFEAFASRLPVIADVTTPPMPQEAGTAELLAANGAGVLLKRATDIGSIVRRMVEDDAYLESLQKAAFRLAVPDAARKIATKVAALAPRGPGASDSSRTADATAPATVR